MVFVAFFSRTIIVPCVEFLCVWDRPLLRTRKEDVAVGVGAAACGLGLEDLAVGVGGATFRGIDLHIFEMIGELRTEFKLYLSSFGGVIHIEAFPFNFPTNIRRPDAAR